MRKVLLSLCLFISSKLIFSQTNSLPTTGNIGIGTLTPAGVLDIQRDPLTSGNEIYLRGFTVGENQNSNSLRLNLVGLDQKAGFGIQAINEGAYGSKDLVFYAHSGDLHYDYTSYDEVVRFKYNGKVGIGTSTPQAKLDVRGGVSIGSEKLLTLNPDYTGWGELPSGSYIGTNGTNSVTIAPSTDVASVGAKVVLGYASTNWWSALEVANVASGFSNMLLMKSGGNVGIGTSIPQAKLDVNGNIYSNGKIFIGTPDANTLTAIAPYSLAVNGQQFLPKQL